jgi:anhydro-N-acetylmuramic acid kinase
MRVIGLMSGTSFDAIDAAAADLRLDGDDLVMRTLGHLSRPYSAQVHATIAAALPPGVTTAATLARVDTLVGQAFAEVAVAAVAELCDGAADLVVSHGQTVYHWVEDGQVRGSLQLGQPAWIAERTGLPVVADLRARDIAAGGQGAPLVSLVDVLLLGTSPWVRAALNLGGIANMTVVPLDGPPLAFDTGPANALIDAAVVHFSGGAERFDVDGAWAAKGRVDDRLLGALLADPYYAAPPPKSTGKEHFHLSYLLDALDAAPQVEPADVIATVTRLAAEAVAEECRRYGVREVISAGGGTRNPTLMGMLSDATPGVRHIPIDALGIPASAKEAYAFAVLGFLAVHGLAGTVPSCTGARSASVLGNITPGAEPLVLPPPAVSGPRRLRLAGAQEFGEAH